jgi:hypothetical protein
MAQRIRWINTAGGTRRYCTASFPASLEVGRTYRVTGQIDTSGLESGTPVEIRAGRDSRLVPTEYSERDFFGAWTGYANGGWLDIDLRFACYTASPHIGLSITDAYEGRSGNPVPVRRPGMRQDDAVIVRATPDGAGTLRVEEFLDTLHGQPTTATTTTTEIRKQGVVFTFNRAVTVGMYANRDFWFLDPNPGNPTPLACTSIWPECRKIYFTRSTDPDGAQRMRFSATPTPTWASWHGAAINPWADGWEQAQANSTKARLQEWEDNFWTSRENTINSSNKEAEYGDPVQQNLQYDAGFNLDPSYSGRPILCGTIAKTIVKAVHFETTVSRFGNDATRGRLKSLTPVTYVTTPPAAGSFRPHPGKADKTPTHNVSAMNIGILPSLAPPSGAPSTVKWPETLRWCEHMTPFWMRQFPSGPGMVPTMSTAVYPSSGNIDQCDAAFIPLYTNELEAPQKERLAIAMVQAGLDMHQDNLMRIWPFAESGGKSIHKPYAVIASLLLGDTVMQAEITRSAIQWDVQKNPSLPPSERYYPYYEDGMWGFVPAAAVSAIRKPPRVNGIRPTMKYFPENVGMPAQMESDNPYKPWVTDATDRYGVSRNGNPAGHNLWDAVYRDTGVPEMMPAVLAMHLIPGARAVHGNEANLRWYDMYFRRVAKGTGENVPLAPYAQALWKAYRSQKPVPVSRLGLKEIDYTDAQAVAIIADDVLESSGIVLRADGAGSGAPDTLSYPNRMRGVPRIRTFRVGSPMTFALAPEWFVDPDALAVSLLNPDTIPTSYSLVSGTLPAGLTLNATTGIVSGTPLTTSPVRTDLPGDPTVRARQNDPSSRIRATDIVVRASNARGSSDQLIRFGVVSG